MSAGTDAPPADSPVDPPTDPPTQPTRSARHVDPDLRRSLAILLGVQGIWMWWAFAQGWFLQADLSNLSEAVGRSLNWGYLTEPLGGHFAPINRVVYWVMVRIGQLDYAYTVAFRVGAQLVATWLLYLVLVELIGRRPLVLGVLAVYALNPLLLAGGAWLTSGTGLIPAQAFALAALLAFLRYDRDRTLRRAALTGLLLALSVLAADQWVVTAPAILLLAVVNLYQGTFTNRLRELACQWKAWLLIYAPLALATIGLLSFSDPTGAGGLSVGSGYRLLRESWLKTLAPSWIGGPWHWLDVEGVYLGYSAPPDWFVLLAQLGVLVTVLVGVRRRGWISLASWIMPVVCAVAGILVIGIGRYSTYGLLLAVIPRYLYQAVAFFAVGAALALAPLRRPGEGPTTPRAAPRHDRVQGLLGWAMATLVVLACFVTGARFATELGRSPARDYVENLETSVRAHGTAVNLFDTSVPSGVITSIEPRHRVSDIAGLFGLKVQFQDPSSEPLVVTHDGHLAKSNFLSVAVGTGNDGTCGTFVHGKGTWTIRLDQTPRPAEWFLRLELYESQPSDVRVRVIDDEGHLVTPLGGGNLHLGRLEARNLALPSTAPTAVLVESASPDTNLCIVHARVGAPFPAGSS